MSKIFRRLNGDIVRARQWAGKGVLNLYNFSPGIKSITTCSDDSVILAFTKGYSITLKPTDWLIKNTDGSLYKLPDRIFTIIATEIPPPRELIA